jgi:hypothetical protein
MADQQGTRSLSRPFLDTFKDRWDNDPEFRAAMKEAESPCAICGRAILCGGCPSKHPDCSEFSDHKAAASHA